MIMNAGEKFDDFDEKYAHKFLNMLEQQTEKNIDKDLDIDTLKKKMEQDDIPIEKFDVLIGIMKNNQIVEYHLQGGQSWITIHPLRAREVQHVLRSKTCPECHKRILKTKTITYCPECYYPHDIKKAVK